MIFLVPRTRVELAHPKRAPAPQAGASTNFAIWAIFSFRPSERSSPKTWDRFAIWAQFQLQKNTEIRTANV